MAERAVFQTTGDVNKGLSSDAFSPNSESDSLGLK